MEKIACESTDSGRDLLLLAAAEKKSRERERDRQKAAINDEGAIWPRGVRHPSCPGEEDRETERDGARKENAPWKEGVKEERRNKIACWTMIFLIAQRSDRPAC